MPYEQAREACHRLLVDLDEDIRDYIIDMLGGDETEEEMKAAVTEFLVSTEHCADEDEATGATAPEPPTGISTFALFGLSEQQMGLGGGRMPALPGEPPTF